MAGGLDMLRVAGPPHSHRASPQPQSQGLGDTGHSTFHLWSQHCPCPDGVLPWKTLMESQEPKWPDVLFTLVLRVWVKEHLAWTPGLSNSW